MANDIQVAVYLDADMKAALDQLREDEGIAVNAFIRLAIAERLERWHARQREPRNGTE